MQAPGRRPVAGFVLPALLLATSLAGVLALALATAATQAARHTQALLARRQAFEAAENAINQALQTASTHPPPWDSEYEDESNLRIAVSVRRLGHWPVQSTLEGLPPAAESHERIGVSTTTPRGARIQLEQDYVRPVPEAATAIPKLRRTAWRELVPEDAP